MSDFWTKIAVVAIFGMGMFVFPYASKATEHVACSDKDTLLVVIEQGIPVDDDGSTIVHCSLLPADYITTGNNAVLMMAFGLPFELGKTCTVFIVRAETDGQPYWYEVGYVDCLPADAVEEALVGVDKSVLAIGIPGLASPISPLSSGDGTMLAIAE